MTPPMGTQLLGIIAEARAVRAEDDAFPLLTCPVCGNNLTINAAGVRNCDVGHYRTSAQTLGAATTTG